MCRLKCDEALEEPATTRTETVSKIECNINASTNFMLSGIMDVHKNIYTISRPRSLTEMFCIGTQSKAGKDLTFAWPWSDLYPKIAIFAATGLLDRADGTLCVEDRHQQEGQDHG